VAALTTEFELERVRRIAIPADLFQFGTALPAKLQVFRIFKLAFRASHLFYHMGELLGGLA